MKVLLIVDDMVETATMFPRFLRKQFEEVHVAHSASSAEERLREGRVTHLLVDETLAPGDPNGSVLLGRWRSAYPQLRWAGLFTGHSERRQAPPPQGADEVFIKPNDFEALIARLRSLGMEGRG